MVGLNSQVLHIQLQPNQKVLAEPGTFMHAQSGVTPTTKCYWSCARYASGESQFVTRFRNTSKESQIIGLAPMQPGSKIVPVDLGEELIGGKLSCLKGAWFATLGKARLTFSADCRLATCCFGGQGLRQQVIKGKGTVFLVGGGTVLRREMMQHERVVLDDHALLAWSGTVSFAARVGCDQLGCGASLCGTCCRNGEVTKLNMGKSTQARK